VSPVLRVAASEDAALLARIHEQCFEEHWDAVTFGRLLERPGAFALVAMDSAGPDVQAFILVQVAADEAEILSIGTLTRARRSGLARALLNEAMAEAARGNAQAMFLEVAEDNLPALALYGVLGFTATGRRRSYYSRAVGSAADALILRAALPARGMGMMRGLD
jgi:ribosomal-protein-alanine N-acetyltransferase